MLHIALGNNVATGYKESKHMHAVYPSAIFKTDCWLSINVFLVFFWGQNLLVAFCKLSWCCGVLFL